MILAQHEHIAVIFLQSTFLNHLCQYLAQTNKEKILPL